MIMNMWDEEFNCSEYVYGTEANDFLKSHINALPKGRILCLAEGEGRNAVFLAKQGYQVTAVDYSQVGLDKAQALAKKNNVQIECICESLETYDLGEKEWDGIVSIACHFPSAIRQPLYKKVMRGLKNGGVFLIEGYTPDQLKYKTGGPSLADMMTHKETLIEELPDLTFSYLNEFIRDVQEGINHAGTSAVVQGIASRKVKNC